MHETSANPLLHLGALLAVCEPETSGTTTDDDVECPAQQEAFGSSPPSESASTSLSEQRGTYKQYCEDSFRDLNEVVTSSVAEFVENTTTDDIVEILEVENVLDTVKFTILEHL